MISLLFDDKNTCCVFCSSITSYFLNSIWNLIFAPIWLPNLLFVFVLFCLCLCLRFLIQAFFCLCLFCVFLIQCEIWHLLQPNCLICSLSFSLFCLCLCLRFLIQCEIWLLIQPDCLICSLYVTHKTGVSVNHRLLCKLQIVKRRNNHHLKTFDKYEWEEVVKIFLHIQETSPQ